jgi:hypothetical protein
MSLSLRLTVTYNTAAARAAIAIYFTLGAKIERASAPGHIETRGRSSFPLPVIP